MILGVLALQGAVREHVKLFHQLGVETRVVKTERHLQGLSGLVLPGGESTAISLLAHDGFLVRLREAAQNGLPMFGTCAGMILLSTEIESLERGYVGAIDITVSRNASGRQVDSFETTLNIDGVGSDVPAVFIRAPYITRFGPDVIPMATHNGHCVMARQGHILVASFHPELTEDTRVHQYFVRMVKETGH